MTRDESTVLECRRDPSSELCNPVLARQACICRQLLIVADTSFSVQVDLVDPAFHLFGLVTKIRWVLYPSVSCCGCLEEIDRYNISHSATNHISIEPKTLRFCMIAAPAGVSPNFDNYHSTQSFNPDQIFVSPFSSRLPSLYINHRHNP